MFPLLQRDWLFRWTTLRWVKATAGRVRGKPAYLYPPESIPAIQRLVELVTSGHTHKSAYAQFLRERAEPAELVMPGELGRLAAGLRSAREQKGLTTAELALRAGVSPQIIDEMENGTNPGAYSAFSLARVAKLLGLSLDEQLAHIQPEEQRIDEQLKAWVGSDLFEKMGESVPPFDRQPFQVRRGIHNVLTAGEVTDLGTLGQKLWEDPDIGISKRVANYSIGPEPSLEEKITILRVLGILARKG